MKAKLRRFRTCVRTAAGPKKYFFEIEIFSNFPIYKIVILWYDIIGGVLLYKKYQGEIGAFSYVTKLDRFQKTEIGAFS